MNDIANPPYAPTALDEPDRSILDPGIVALLDFEPAPRQVPRPDGWTPARQRRFIVQLALTGSPKAAADLMGKNLSGLKHLYRTDGADSFRAAWKAAIELAASRKRNHRASALPASSEVPGTASRSLRGQHKHKPGQSCGECGQVVEEMTEERQEYLDTMQPDIVTANQNSGGGGAGAALGGILGHFGGWGSTVGAVAGGINVKKGEAAVTLDLVNARTTEDMALTQGYARKKDVSWGAGGGAGWWGGFAAAGGGGYQNTEIGQVIVLAYLDAYIQMVTQLGGLPANPSAAAPQAQ